ncbi:MAG: hypothetical protein R2688_10200 [Fimbriimonadaceae bacterium]
MVTIRFENWTLATVDSSWSRPKNDKTWGNVTLKVLGERIERSRSSFRGLTF